MYKRYDLSSYEELKNKQGYIMDEDFEPKVIDDVLF
jgi:hypothetical protein